MIVTYYNSFIVSQLDDNISKGPNVWYEVIMVNIYFLKIFEKEQYQSIENEKMIDYRIQYIVNLIFEGDIGI